MQIIVLFYEKIKSSPQPIENLRISYEYWLDFNIEVSLRKCRYLAHFWIHIENCPCARFGEMA